VRDADRGVRRADQGATRAIAGDVAE
jgi:hypothetical protein